SEEAGGQPGGKGAPILHGTDRDGKAHGEEHGDVAEADGLVDGPRGEHGEKDEEPSKTGGLEDGSEPAGEPIIFGWRTRLWAVGRSRWQPAAAHPGEDREKGEGDGGEDFVGNLDADCSEGCVEERERRWVEVIVGTTLVFRGHLVRLGIEAVARVGDKE